MWQAKYYFKSKEGTKMRQSYFRVVVMADVRSLATDYLMATNIPVIPASMIRLDFQARLELALG